MRLCAHTNKVSVFKYIYINIINYTWDVEHALRLKRELNMRPPQKLGENLKKM